MQNLRLPILISIVLHLCIGALLFIQFKSKPQAANNVNIVQAVAIHESQLNAASTPTPPVIPQKPSELPQQNIRQIEQTALHQQSLAKEKPVEAKPLPEPTPEPPPTTKVVTPELSAPIPKIDNKASQLAAKQAAAQEQKLAETKRKQAIKSHEEELAKQRREEETKQLAKELGIETKSHAEAEQMPVPETTAPAQPAEEGLEEQLGAEKKSLTKQIAASNEAGEIDRYKLMIIQSISRNWIMPEIEDKSLACQVLVHLGPGGIVIDAEVVKSSGDENLDRSARNAIMKASPLPVPEKSELFDNFRALRLTFRPQGIISS